MTDRSEDLGGIARSGLGSLDEGKNVCEVGKDVEREMPKFVRISGGDISGKVDCLELEDVRIYRVADADDIAWPARALFSQLTDEEMSSAEPLLPPGALNAARSEIRLSFNSFLIQTPTFVALIDAGIGNGKVRLDRPAWHLRSGAFLSDLEALGFPPDRIDLVINTHLHADHVGWNTVAEGLVWRPTFRRARYVVSRDELEHWLMLDRDAPAGTILHGAFADSVQPLLDAGVLDTVPVPSELGHGLRLEPAPGHSPGMAVVRLTAGKRSVLFLADVVHHPLQLAMPHIGSNFCADPAQARATRDRILADSFDDSTILAPYHFTSPAFGCLRKENGRLGFSPLLQQGCVQDHANWPMASSSGQGTGRSR